MNNDAKFFEKIITELFHRHFDDGIMVSTTEIRKNTIKLSSGNEVDLYLYREKDEELASKIEIKYYRSSYVPLRILRNASYAFKINAAGDRNPVNVMVVSCLLDRVSRHALYEEFDHYFIDRDDLLYMAMPYPDITEILLDFFSDEVDLDGDGKLKRESIAKRHVLSMTTAINELENTHRESGVDSKNNHELISKQPEQNEKFLQLKNDLTTLNPGRSGWAKYEEICKEILMFLFDKDLTGWFKQMKTDDGLNRYDLVCRIKSNESAWDFIANQLKSQYIVFEFKNYKDEIKQDQITSTEKYLFENALRKVAIIISRKGASESAIKMRDGAMRENGKMILIIKDDDLIKMMEDTVNGNQSAGEYIYNLIDDMLLKLSR